VRTLADWLAHSLSSHARSVDLGLDRVRTVAARLALLEPRRPVIIVGGTNGKGSTASTIAALLGACGRRPGLFTSPHLLRYNERIQIAGQPVDDAELVRAFMRIEQIRGEVTLTFFEYNALVALEVFRAAAVDAVVLEVGLGGRLDATNIIDADVAVLCSVDIDHREWLGATREQIGREKAGIFRRRQQVVLGTPDMPASVWQAASALECALTTAERDFHWEVAAGGRWRYRSAPLTLPDLPAPALAGTIQYRNAATAIAALQLLDLDASREPERIGAGLAAVRLPGRFQLVAGPVQWLLDVAHNAAAAAVLAAELRSRPVPGRTLAVAGMLADKDAAAVAMALDPLVDAWILCGIEDEPRGLRAVELRGRIGTLRGTIALADSVREALERARAVAHSGDRVLVFGSFHVVGPALAWLGYT
jgi:dihydrofolate synthase/folylpolyglutamate synthase